MKLETFWKIYLNLMEYRAYGVEIQKPVVKFRIPPSWHVEIQLLSISNHHRSWWTPMVTGLREPRKPISIFFSFSLSSQLFSLIDRNTNNIYFDPFRNCLLRFFPSFVQRGGFLIKWRVFYFLLRVLFYFLKEIIEKLINSNRSK